MPQKLLLRNTQSPGDIVVLTAAVRDLVRAHPGLYDIDMHVSAGADHIFWHNPHIKSVRPSPAGGRGAQTFRAGYDEAISRSNQDRKHFLWGFIEFMNLRLRTGITLTEFRPDLHMSEAERKQRPFEEPYWVFLSGGKQDFDVKLWDQAGWQQVIDATRDRVNWVQCGGGSSNHIMHVPKRGIYADMVGKTNCRDFIRLIYHAEGVACVITMAMHVAAAFNKPCVVVAGGTEPWWWEAYNLENRLVNMRMRQPAWRPPSPDNFVPHAYLHTIGQLDCCKTGGCWKKHVKPGHNTCKYPINQNGILLPRCKTMITPDMVVAAIDDYLAKGLARRIKPAAVTSVPHAAMRSVVDTPALGPEPAAPVGTDARLVVCLARGATIPDELRAYETQAVRANDEAELLKLACQRKEPWLIWVGSPVVPKQQPWVAHLLTRLGQPAIYGRIHRTPTGTYYPYPGFFVAHRDLLVPGDSFTEAFVKVPVEAYRTIGDLVTLPTLVQAVR